MTADVQVLVTSKILQVREKRRERGKALTTKTFTDSFSSSRMSRKSSCGHIIP
jgi:hypothetical protein